MQMIDHDPAHSVLRPESKLEQSKAKRRAAIIGAAHDLIRETGETGFSMRALAARAKVSLATPYNLFGSKQTILIALLNNSATAFGELFRAQASGNHLSRIFEYLDMSFDLYRSDLGFYQALMRTLYRSEDAELRMKLRKPRARFLKQLLSDIVAARYLEPDLEVDLVSSVLLGIYFYSVQEWAHGSVTLERARLETEYGFCLILIGVATDDATAELQIRRNLLQAAIEHQKRAEQTAMTTPGAPALGLQGQAARGNRRAQ